MIVLGMLEYFYGAKIKAMISLLTFLILDQIIKYLTNKIDWIKERPDAIMIQELSQFKLLIDITITLFYGIVILKKNVQLIYIKVII